MKITLYKGLGFAHDTIEVEEGKSLCQSLPDIDFNHAAVVVNAVKSDGFYKPKEGDGIIVRVLPQGATAALVIGIVSIALSVAGGIAAGVIAYKQKRELEKLKSQTNNDSATNLPFLKGATNSLATGKSQPYLMGRNFFTPYLLTRKWYSLEGVDGKTQFVTQAFECGFGKQVFEKVQADDILIKTFDKSLGPQEGCSDLIDDSESGGFSAGGKIDIVQSDGLFAGLTEANVRVASDTPQAEIPRAADISAGKKDKLVYSLDPNAKNVHIGITFGSGLYYMNPNTGGKQNKSVIITPSYSLDGGTTWIPFSFNQQSVIGYEEDYYDTVKFYQEAYNANRTISQYQSMGYSVVSKEFDFLHGQAAYHVTMRKHIQEKPIYGLTPGNTFTRNTIDEIRFEAVREFTLSDYETLHLNEQAQILIQVVNETAYDSNSRDTAQLLYYQSQCFDPDKSETPAGTMSEEDYEEAYPEGTGLEDCEVVSLKVRSLSTMMAVRLKASQANESKMGKINFVSNSLAKVCEDGEWSEEKEITANPAALLVEVLQSHTHPLSAFDDDELDLDAFADLYDFCETEEIRFNAVATQKNTKQKLLEQICSVCRATLYWNAEGKLSVAWDCAQDTIVAALDSDSIIDVENEKEFTRPVDAIRATWLDESDWKQKSYTILNNGVTELDADSVIKDLNITGLTTFDQVAKFVRYTMACMNIRQKTVNVKVGNEGVCFSPCTRVTVNDDSLGDTPQNLLITSASSNGNGWTLKCVDYDARVYNPGDIPEYKSSIEQLNRPASGLPSIYVTAGEFDEYKSKMSQGELVVGAPNKPNILTCEAQKSGVILALAPVGGGARNTVAEVEWQKAIVSATKTLLEDSDWRECLSSFSLETEYRFDRSVDGYPEKADLCGQRPNEKKWWFRAKVKNAYNQESEWSEPVLVNADTYGTWIPQRPVISNLNEDKSTRFVTLNISQPSGQNLYATVAYRVGVKRADRTEEPFYLPNVYGDPFGNENTYKEDAGHQAVEFSPATSGHFIEVQRTFKQNVPLIGQNKTIYKHKLVKTAANVPDAALQTWYTESQMDSESEGSYDDNGTRIQFDLMTWTTSEGVNTGTMVVGDYTYTLTSSGELASNPEPTVYTYKIVPYAVETGTIHTSLDLEASVRAEPSRIQDIVDNSITSNKLAPDAVVAEKIAAGTITADKMAVDQLSAITANMGAITDGALTGNSNNFWALTAGEYNGIYRAKGTFRVGDENNYIEVKAYNRNDVEVTSKILDDGKFNYYRLFFKAGTFEVTSEISTFQNDFAIYQDSNMSRLFMTASGMTLQRLVFQEGETIPTPLEQSYWAEHPEKIEMVAKFYADENGNLIVTNSSDSSSIGFATEVPEGLTVYQLNSTHKSGGEFVDLDDEDPDNLNLSDENQATVSPMSFLKRKDGTYETECYDGDITISTGRKFMVYNKGCFLSAGSENVKIGISKVEADWNSEKSVEWGLSAAQVSTLKLTVEAV